MLATYRKALLVMVSRGPHSTAMLQAITQELARRQADPPKLNKHQ